MITPNANDVETKKWEEFPWNVRGTYQLRDFHERYQLRVDQSLYQRMANTLAPIPYAPHLPKQALSIMLDVA